MPERLSDVEGLDRDLLGSEDLNEGGRSAVGFCWAAARVRVGGNMEMKMAR